MLLKLRLNGAPDLNIFGVWEAYLGHPSGSGQLLLARFVNQPVKTCGGIPKPPGDLPGGNRGCGIVAYGTEADTTPGSSSGCLTRLPGYVALRRTTMISVHEPPTNID